MSNFFHTPFRILVFVIGLLLPTKSYTQDTIPHTTQDSLLLALQVSTWKEIPTYKDSLMDWQVSTVIAVLKEKTTRLSQLFDLDYQQASAIRAINESDFLLLKQDTATTKDSLIAANQRLKTAQKIEKSLKKPLDESNNLLGQLEKATELKPAVKRKTWPKLFKKWSDLAQKYDQMHAPPPPIAPPPAIVEVPTTDTTTMDTSAQSVSRLDQWKKKLKPKEKAPEKPKAAVYSAEKDVMITPPVPPCAIAIERKDAFTGAVYRETKKQELFRYTNAVMRKVLPENQSHIIARAGLATDGDGGRLLLEITIKDLNARRSFGGLATKSILSIKFLDGETITLFNENSQEVQIDPERETATFMGSYPVQNIILRKLEKKEIDQVRIAWSAGYEDYEVHHVSLLQQLSNCLK